MEDKWKSIVSQVCFRKKKKKSIQDSRQQRLHRCPLCGQSSRGVLPPYIQGWGLHSDPTLSRPGCTRQPSRGPELELVCLQPGDPFRSDQRLRNLGLLRVSALEPGSRQWPKERVREESAAGCRRQALCEPKLLSPSVEALRGGVRGPQG